MCLCPCLCPCPCLVPLCESQGGLLLSFLSSPSPSPPLCTCCTALHFSYHIPTIHPGLSRDVDMRTYRVQVSGASETELAGAGGQGGGMVEHLTETAADSAYNSQGGGGLWVWQYPSLAINWYGPGLR